jgi:TolB-like protein/AraC-like DNA-binding protein/Tfp pilus assembly protein PilF
MTTAKTAFLETLDALIEANFRNPNFSTDDICEALAVSRSQLFRLIKEQTNLSITLYIRQRKLLKAKELLDSPDLKINEIVYEIGIESPQDFSKYFKQEFGFTPSEYRKNKANFVEEKIAQVIDNEGVTEEFRPLTKPESKPKKMINKWILIALAFISLSTLVGIYFWKNNAPKAETAADLFEENSLAILPFKNLGLPENALFADGLVQQLHSSLTTLPNLKLISQTSSNKFKESPKKIAQIASELNVKYILTGNVLQNNQSIKLNIELIKGDDDRSVWARNYEGEAKNALAFMSKIAKEIAQELHQKLSVSEIKALDKVPTENLEAYTALLQGKQLMQTRVKEKMEASILKFDEAIAFYPDFADAYTAKASAYFILGNFHFMDMAQSVKMAEKNALAAIRLDATNGTAYAVLAGTYKLQYKWEQSRTTYDIALKYNPNDAQINYWYSLLLRSIGDFEGAIQYSQKAMKLDPLFPVILGGYINSCTYAGEFDLAEEAIKKGELIFNNDYMYYYSRGFYQLSKGEYTDAIKEFQHSDSLSKYSKDRSGIAYCQAKLGQQEAVLQYIKSLPPTADNYVMIATAYAGLEDTENTFKYLFLAADQNQIPDYFKISPVFKFLRKDKRFNQILEKFGLLDAQLAQM